MPYVPVDYRGLLQMHQSGQTAKHDPPHSPDARGQAVVRTGSRWLWRRQWRPYPVTGCRVRCHHNQSQVRRKSATFASALDLRFGHLSSAIWTCFYFICYRYRELDMMCIDTFDFFTLLQFLLYLFTLTLPDHSVSCSGRVRDCMEATLVSPDVAPAELLLLRKNSPE